jgi:F-type H+-transporting ATPase subunit b
MITLLLAAEGEGGGNPVSFELAPFVTAIVVFLIVLAILAAKVWPMITKGLDEREQKILDEIQSAESAREKANVALKEYEESLATARQEAGEMITKARDDAKAAGEELRRRNDAELTEMKLRATREIESAKQAAIADLHGQAAQLASAMAAKILQRDISPQDQQNLVEETLRELRGLQEA